MISQQTSSEPLLTSSSAWGRLGVASKTLVVYAVSIAIYVPLYYFPQNVFAPLRALSGLFLLIMLPGAQVSRVALPKEMRNLWTSLAIGLLVAVLEAQIAFTLSLFFGLQVPFFYWLFVPSMVILWGSLLLDHIRGQCDPPWSALQLGIDKILLWILVVALAVRVPFYLMTGDVIAPDAALYADFARGIMDGFFQSSVVNETCVVELWNGVHTIPHQAFVYLFAISWLLLPPAVSGPTFVLLLAGLMLVPASFWITEYLFGSTAGHWVSLIVSIHPIFVFHSAAGYGPEITSLMFALFGLLLICKGRKRSPRTLFVGGLMIGLIDVIWYPNFLILCIAVSIFLLFSRVCSIVESLSVSGLLAILLLARLFYANMVVFFACWAALFSLLALMRFRVKGMDLHRLAPSFIGVMVVILFWRWPTQIVESVYDASILPGGASLTSLAIVNYQTILKVLNSSIEPMIVARFLLFLAFHLSIPLLALFAVSIMRGEKLNLTRSLLLVAAASAFGTLLVFGTFSKAVLLPIYVYSDSRFFLSIILVMILSLGGVLSRIDFAIKEKSVQGSWLPPTIRKKRNAIILLSLIVVGFIPNYLAMPVGLDLIRIEQRYGWSGLSNQVDDLGTTSSLFLVDRAREFSWLTRRSSATLFLSTSDNTTAKALARITLMVDSLGVDYLVMDGYTLARWGTMHSLLSTSISIGGAVLLDMFILSELEDLNVTGQVPAIALVAETSPNIRGDFTRVFEFTQTDFSRTWKLDSLDGWYAENNGDLVNLSGQVEIVIGNGKNYTQMRRAATLDLGVGVSGGFLLCHVTENGANLERIEVVDAYGESIGFAEPWTDGLYFLIVGDADVGDIRITCSGEEGQSIAVDYLALWQHSQ